MRVIVAIIIVVEIVAFCGCQKAPSSTKTAPIPAPAAVAIPQPVAPKSTTATSAAQSTGKRKSTPAIKGTNAQSDELADPESTFIVEALGETLEVESTSGVLESDRFVVTVASIRFDASDFLVDSADPSTLSFPYPINEKSKTAATIPKGFTVLKEWGSGPDGFPVRIRCDKTGSILALVPVGPSLVGTDDGPEESKPSFKVKLDTFYMEVVEVSVGQYEQFRIESKEKDKKKSTQPNVSNPDAHSRMPALGLPFAAAQNYARWAGMELPTEAEFEKAARGPTGLRRPWGDTKSLWTTREISATGSIPEDRSPYGIYDLAGNAKEWCVDHYSSTAHKEAVAASTKDVLQKWSGPKNVRDVSLRVVKGSSENQSAWFREGKDGGKSDREIGFRCVLRLPAKKG